MKFSFTPCAPFWRPELAIFFLQVSNEFTANFTAAFDLGRAGIITAQELLALDQVNFEQSSERQPAASTLRQRPGPSCIVIKS